jgi:hypothetical protein
VSPQDRGTAAGPRAAWRQAGLGAFPQHVVRLASFVQHVVVAGRTAWRATMAGIALSPLENVAGKQENRDFPSETA